MRITPIVVLTNGFTPSGQPTITGQARIKEGQRLHLQLPCSHIYIVGGQRAAETTSEAYVYRRWAINELGVYPEEITAIAEAKYMAGDMDGFSKHLREIGAVSCLLATHPSHAALAAITLRHHLPSLAIDCRDTLEVAPYSPLKLAVLNFVTSLDPCWRKPISAPLRFLANRRGRRG